MSQFTVTLLDLNRNNLGVGNLTITPQENNQVSISLSITSGTLDGFNDTVVGTMSQCNNGQTTCIAFQGFTRKGIKILQLNTYAVSTPLITVQAAAGLFYLSYNGGQYTGILGGGGANTQ
jgi:hypothetical protein